MSNGFIVGGAEHEVGAHRCLECWTGYPKKCQCKGLIHCQFVKENWEGHKTLVYSCDSCGDQYNQSVQNDKPARRKQKWKRTK